MEQDTTPEQRERYWHGLRQQPLEERLRQIEAMWVDGRALVEAGIRALSPGASDAEVQERVAVRLYGPVASALLARRGHG